MKENRNYRYYVVELIDPQYTGVDRYVCVPDSWMGFRQTDSQTAIVKYPMEELSTINKRVEKKEHFKRHWPIFNASVKFATNCYKNAKIYIRFLNKLLIIQQGSFTDRAKKAIDVTTPAVKSRVSEVNSKLNEPSTSGSLANFDSEIRLGGYSDLKEEYEYIGINSDKNDKICFINQASSPHLSNNIPLSTNTKTLEQQNSKRLYDINSKTYKSPENDENSELRNNIIDGDKRSKFSVGGDFLNVLKKMDLSFETKYKNIERLLHECKNQCMIIKTMITSVEHFDKLFNDIVITMTLETKENHESAEIMIGIEKKKEDNGINVDNDDHLDNVDVSSVDSDNSNVNKDDNTDFDNVDVNDVSDHNRVNYGNAINVDGFNVDDINSSDNINVDDINKDDVSDVDNVDGDDDVDENLIVIDVDNASFFRFIGTGE